MVSVYVEETRREGSDRELLGSFCREGDEGAFSVLVERHGAMVNGVARRRGLSPESAREVVQRVFAILARKAGRLSSGVVLGGWLYRTAVFESDRAWRKEARQRAALEEYAARQRVAVELEGVDGAGDGGLDEALAGLSEGERDVLVLRFYEGLNYRELGERLGKSEAAAQKQTERVLKRLRGRMGGGTGVAGVVAMLGERLAPTSMAAGEAGGLAAGALAMGGKIGMGTLLVNAIYTTMTKTQLMVVGGVLVAGAAAVTWQLDARTDQETRIAKLGAVIEGMEAAKVLQIQASRERVVGEAATSGGEPDPVSPVVVARGDAGSAGNGGRGPQEAPAELRPIQVATDPASLGAGYASIREKMVEMFEKYGGNKIVPYGTPERDAYDAEVAEMMTLISDGMMAASILGEDDEKKSVTGALLGAALGNTFDFGAEEQEEVGEFVSRTVTERAALKRQFADGEEEEQEARLKEYDDGALAGLEDLLGDERWERFIEVYGNEFFGSFGFSMPAVPGSGAEAEAIVNKVKAMGIGPEGGAE